MIQKNRRLKAGRDRCRREQGSVQVASKLGGSRSSREQGVSALFGIRPEGARLSASLRLTNERQGKGRGACEEDRKISGERERLQSWRRRAKPRVRERESAGRELRFPWNRAESRVRGGQQ
ncbi:hypothetical protein KFK09_003020 [Dendrobium nobile]|uniref:Uncharacterized protein n=1 Tax=Dendrobium nobile TaxID=94219 RepID=A0A8T3C7Y5_DENNO|nr:hypothetical protein KFK09_003020 [Dendrobium nobile]